MLSWKKKSDRLTSISENFDYYDLKEKNVASKGIIQGLTRIEFKTLPHQMKELLKAALFDVRYGFISIIKSY
jgi:hypothetical protein